MNTIKILDTSFYLALKRVLYSLKMAYMVDKIISGAMKGVRDVILGGLSIQDVVGWRDRLRKNLFFESSL